MTLVQILGFSFFLQNVLELLSLLSASAAKQRIAFSGAETNTIPGAFMPSDFSPFKKNLVPFPAPPGVVHFNQREHLYHTWVHTKTLGPRPPEIVDQKHLVQSSPSENIKTGTKSQAMLDSTD